ncbi:MAG: carboxymuconolactone decarboxylase family protein [Bacteroidota bacterium]
MRDIPKRFTDFADTYPEIARAYEQLGAACHLAGPIGKKERALLKLGISMGAWLEGAVHSHVRKSLEAGATPEEIRHVALLALPTLGFPSTMAVLTWVEDILPKGGKPKGKQKPGRKTKAKRKVRNSPRRRR